MSTLEEILVEIQRSTTHYETLGFRSGDGVSQADLKKNYYKRSLLVHPDKNPGKNTDEAFKTLAQAYDVLKEPTSRTSYDQKLAALRATTIFSVRPFAHAPRPNPFYDGAQNFNTSFPFRQYAPHPQYPHPQYQQYQQYPQHTAPQHTAPPPQPRTYQPQQPPPRPQPQPQPQPANRTQHPYTTQTHAHAHAPHPTPPRPATQPKHASPTTSYPDQKKKRRRDEDYDDLEGIDVSNILPKERTSRRSKEDAQRKAREQRREVLDEYISKAKEEKEEEMKKKQDAQGQTAQENGSPQEKKTKAHKQGIKTEHKHEERKDTKSKPSAEEVKEEKQEEEEYEEEEEAEEAEYTVEKIVGKRVFKGRIKYKIHWQGYPPDEDSWEWAEDCFCPELIDQYEKELKEATASKKSRTTKNSRKKGGNNNEENNPNNNEENNPNNNNNTKKEVPPVVIDGSASEEELPAQPNHKSRGKRKENVIIVDD